MKAYSVDLRKKVISAYQTKQGTMRKLSERFMVSLIFVFNLIKNFRLNGHINPKPHGGGRSPAINEEGCRFIPDLLKSENDLTLEELCDRYGQKFGQKVCISSMNRTLEKLKITRKKKICMIPKKILRESKN